MNNAATVKHFLFCCAGTCTPLPHLSRGLLSGTKQDESALYVHVRRSKDGDDDIPHTAQQHGKPDFQMKTVEESQAPKQRQRWPRMKEMARLSTKRSIHGSSVKAEPQPFGNSQSFERLRKPINSKCIIYSMLNCHQRESRYNRVFG